MIELTVPDLLIDVLIAPNRLVLSSRDEVTEVAAVDILEGILSTSGIAYAVKGRHYEKESVPYELDFLFNSLYGGKELKTIAKVLQGILVEKGFTVEVD